jgi:hypothetical protein
MTVDDLRELVHAADGVDGHSPDRLAEVHRRIDRARRRRAASAVAAAVVVVLALVAGSFALADLTGRTPDPADSHRPQPSPTRSESERPTVRFQPKAGAERLTPRQTVLSDNAVLLQAVTAFDDPDVRVSLWETTCFACVPPCEGCRPNPTFRALAVTADGYRTTRYLRPRLENFRSITRMSGHTFLLDGGPGFALRLLDTKGRLRTVRMVDEVRRPDDPGLLFQCDRTYAGGGEFPSGWCVLDIRTATAASLPETFIATGHSAARPALGQRPWGLDLSVPYYYYGAWWADHGVRRYADLPGFGSPPQRPTGPPELIGQVVSLSDDDTPTYYYWPLWSDHVDVFTVRDRSGGLRKIASRPWLPLTREQMSEVGHPKELGIYAHVVRTPDGGLLAWDYGEFSHQPGLRVWRADSLTSGQFRTVYEGGRQALDTARSDPEITVHDGRIYLDTLVSDDDGRTWTEPVTTWRP